MATATVEAIRDRVYTLLEAQTPTSLSSTLFRRYRNEEGARFDDWAEKNLAASFRRFQVRQIGTDELPNVSDTNTERVRMKQEIRIAYPQTHRYGGANAMDRDDVINQDWLKINRAIGIYGRTNFSGSHDCVPLGATMEMDRSGKVDYLVVIAEFEYLRSTT